MATDTRERDQLLDVRNRTVALLQITKNNSNNNNNYSTTQSVWATIAQMYTLYQENVMCVTLRIIVFLCCTVNGVCYALCNEHQCELDILQDSMTFCEYLMQCSAQVAFMGMGI